MRHNATRLSDLDAVCTENWCNPPLPVRRQQSLLELGWNAPIGLKYETRPGLSVLRRLTTVPGRLFVKAVGLRLFGGEARQYRLPRTWYYCSINASHSNYSNCYYTSFMLLRVHRSFLHKNMVPVPQPAVKTSGKVEGGGSFSVFYSSG